MRYISTCGTLKDVPFETVVLSGGYTSDGGVFVPETVPHTFSIDTLQLLQGKPFPLVSLTTARVFITEEEISNEDLNRLVNSGLEPSKFLDSKYIPLTKLRSNSNGRQCLLVAEPFHSPSLVFKDYSMQLVGQYVNYFLGKKRLNSNGGEKNKTNILICTTGDTGSSAIQALKGLNEVNVIVGFPDGSQITEFQRKQMTTVQEENVHCFQAQGSCDDIDLVYLKLFADPELVNKYNLSSCNSTNWARIMGQIAIFVFIYLEAIEQLCRRVGEELTMVIPTGACGNLCSALIAKKMGLPINVIVANNENAFFSRLYHTGQIVVSEVNQKRTISNAMDSQWSPSLPRILWLMSPECSENYDKRATNKIKSRETFPITQRALTSMKENVLDCQVVSDEETTMMMKTVFNWAKSDQQATGIEVDNNYVICPHTAVAFVALLKHRMGSDYTSVDSITVDNCRSSLCTDSPAVVVATAHPDKFSSVINNMANIPYTCTRSFEGVPERFSTLTKGDDWQKEILLMLERVNL